MHPSTTVLMSPIRHLKCCGKERVDDALGQKISFMVIEGLEGDRTSLGRLRQYYD